MSVKARSPIGLPDGSNGDLAKDDALGWCKAAKELAYPNRAPKL
jgi:hypothetical protein